MITRLELRLNPLKQPSTFSPLTVLEMVAGVENGPSFDRALLKLSQKLYTFLSTLAIW